MAHGANGAGNGGSGARPVKAVIFDIDGVIVDSEPLHMEALAYALKAHGLETAEDGSAFIGLSLEETIRRFGVGEDLIEPIRKLSVDYYVEKIGAQHLRPGMKTFWQLLLASDIKVGCVSSAELRICRANINALGLAATAAVPVVGFESVTISKPHPMPYLKMLSILGVNAAEAMVIEDSDTGIASASGAKIGRIYAWPHGLSGTQQYFLAHKTIANLREIQFVDELWGK